MAYPKKYLDLPPRLRRFVNNFMATRTRDDYIDVTNWNHDISLYGKQFEKLKGNFVELKRLFDREGPLPE